jgi:hypothetical protein
MPDEQVFEWSILVFVDAERAADGRRDEIPVVKIGELDEPRSARVIGNHRCGDLNRQARFPDAARADERNETMLPEQLRDGGELARAADEGADL